MSLVDVKNRDGNNRGRFHRKFNHFFSNINVFIKLFNFCKGGMGLGGYGVYGVRGFREFREFKGFKGFRGLGV